MRRAGTGRAPSNSSSAFHLALFSGFRLTSGGRPVRVLRDAQRVIALVALMARPVRRALVAGLLWGEASERRASGNLRSAIWRLQHEGLQVLVTDADHIRLAELVSTDVERLLHWATQAGDRAECALDDAALEELVSFGELLPDWSEDWLAPQRERLHQLRVHVLEACSATLTARQRHARAIDLALAALSADPLRESANRTLISAYLAEGNLSEARRQYHAYTTLLRDELGLQPSAMMEELVAKLSQDRRSAQPQGFAELG